MNTVLRDVDKIILKCNDGKQFVLPYIQDCDLGDDYARIGSITWHEELVKGLVSNLIGCHEVYDISANKKVNSYEHDYGEYVLYKIVREWDVDSICKSIYYFIK